MPQWGDDVTLLSPANHHQMGFGAGTTAPGRTASFGRLGYHGVGCRGSDDHGILGALRIWRRLAAAIWDWMSERRG